LQRGRKRLETCTSMSRAREKKEKKKKMTHLDVENFLKINA